MGVRNADGHAVPAGAVSPLNVAGVELGGLGIPVPGRGPRGEGVMSPMVSREGTTENAHQGLVREA